MSEGDGLMVESVRPSVTLVKFGNVSSKLFDHIDISLNHFIYSFGEELERFTTIIQITRPNPKINLHGEEERIFTSQLNKIPGKIVLGVTDMGIYHRPIDRNLFGFGGSGKGLLSTYRFVHTSKSAHRINERLAKEILKILALSSGLPHCSNPNCILSYHRSVVDLDNNHKVCESCKSSLIQSINYLTGE